MVPLDSPRMAVHVFTPTDVQSPDSADSALSMFAEEVREKNKGVGLEGSAAVSAGILSYSIMCKQNIHLCLSVHRHT